jgi:hypothetical protein
MAFRLKREQKGLRFAKSCRAVKRSQRLSRQCAKKREVEEIDVKMNDVELVRTRAYLIDHQREVRNAVAHRRIKAERASATGRQLGRFDLNINAP